MKELRKLVTTRLGVDKVKPKARYGLSTPYNYIVPPAFGPSCNEFVYPEYWHFDNDAILLLIITYSKIDDVLTEHGRLLYVLPLSVHLIFLPDK